MPCYSFNHGGRDATGISRDGRRSTGRRLSKDNAVTIIPRWDEHHTRVEHKRHELRLPLRQILVESRNDGHAWELEWADTLGHDVQVPVAAEASISSGSIHDDRARHCMRDDWPEEFARE